MNLKKKMNLISNNCFNFAYEVARSDGDVTESKLNSIKEFILLNDREILKIS